MITIACLHTAHSNIAIFDRALASIEDIPRIQLIHQVDTRLLPMAEQAGGITPDIIALTQAQISELSQRSDQIIVTCSTLGQVVDQLPPAAVPVIRVDRVLAQHAVALGGRLLVLCAAPTTLKPTRDLFMHTAAGTATQIDVQLVEGAWQRFSAGDIESYHALIASALISDSAQTSRTVALAQVSMTGAELLVNRQEYQILTSPHACLQQVLASI